MTLPLSANFYRMTQCYRSTWRRYMSACTPVPQMLSRAYYAFHFNNKYLILQAISCVSFDTVIDRSRGTLSHAKGQFFYCTTHMQHMCIARHDAVFTC